MSRSMVSMVAVLVFFAGCIGTTQPRPKEILSGVHESCMKTSHCVKGLKCLRFTCQGEPDAQEEPEFCRVPDLKKVCELDVKCSGVGTVEECVKYLSSSEVRKHELLVLGACIKMSSSCKNVWRCLAKATSKLDTPEALKHCTAPAGQGQGQGPPANSGCVKRDCPEDFPRTK